MIKKMWDEYVFLEKEKIGLHDHYIAERIRLYSEYPNVPWENMDNHSKKLRSLSECRRSVIVKQLNLERLLIVRMEGKVYHLEGNKYLAHFIDSDNEDRLEVKELITDAADEN